MNNNYVVLANLNYGKYSYSVMKFSDKVVYFEIVGNKYVQPITNFNLYDNEGKSLTSVNEHFFMNQLINRINLSCKNGVFVTNDEIINYLNDLKSRTENDLELKKLFKGSLMNQIDEDNFEYNKKQILQYLDKFKCNTFIDYNNVSIFSGSLEKNISSDNSDVNSSNVSSPNVANNVEVSNSIKGDSEVVNASDFFHEQTNSSDLNINNGVNDNSGSNNVEVVDVLQGNSTLESTPAVNEIPNVMEAAPTVNEVSNVMEAAPAVNEVPNVMEAAPTVNEVPNVMEAAPAVNEVPNVMETTPVVNEVPNVMETTPVVNEAPNVMEAAPANNDVDYIEQVKNRIENGSINNSSFNNEMGILDSSIDDFDKTLIIDKPSIPEIEEVGSNASSGDLSNVNTPKKKGSVGVVIFIIILIALLCAFAYFLYNYIF